MPWEEVVRAYRALGESRAILAEVMALYAQNPDDANGTRLDSASERMEASIVDANEALMRYHAEFGHAVSALVEGARKPRSFLGGIHSGR